MYITVEECRRYLNLPFTDDDQLIMELIEIAEDTVEKHIEQPLHNLENISGELPYGLQGAIKALVATLYSNRESIAYGQPYRVPYTLEYLLQPYRNYKKPKAELV